MPRVRAPPQSARRAMGAERGKDIHYERPLRRCLRRHVVTDRAASQHGISAFIFEKDTPGFNVGKKENKLGMRASATGEVLFRIAACRNAVAGEAECEGFVDSLRILDGGRISIAALSVGIAQGAFDAALSYSKHRKQFGRSISEFQAIQHKLADMATDIEAARC